MSKLKSLDEYAKNAGIHIVLGRHNKIPEGLEDGQDVFLMGDCTAGLRKKMEKAGIKTIHTEGCPPGEPFLLWSIVDREETKVPGVDLSPEEFRKASEPIRERMVREEVKFAEWLKKQKRTKKSNRSTE